MKIVVKKLEELSSRFVDSFDCVDTASDLAGKCFCVERFNKSVAYSDVSVFVIKIPVGTHPPYRLYCSWNITRESNYWIPLIDCKILSIIDFFKYRKYMGKNKKA